MAAGHVDAVTAPPLGARRAERVNTPCLARKYRFDNDPGAIFGVSDDFVAGDEGEAHDRLEPARRTPVHRRQVAPTYTGQAGGQPLPTGTGQFRWCDVDQTEGAKTSARTWPQPRCHSGHDEPGQGSVDLECLHISLRPARSPFWLTTGPKGSRGRLKPAARGQ